VASCVGSDNNDPAALEESKLLDFLFYWGKDAGAFIGRMEIFEHTVDGLA